jgi:hypothetical protein
MVEVVAVGVSTGFLSFGCVNLLEFIVRIKPDPSFHLAMGATRLVHVDEGATLVVVRGRLRLNDAQRWLVERAWMSSIELAEGEAHVCDAGGWFRIDASSDCEVLMSGLPKRRLSVPLLEGIIRGWRAAFGRTAYS